MTEPPRLGRSVAIVLAALVTTVLAGCGDDGGGGGSGTASDPVALGQDVFESNCAVCHGAELDGTNNGPALRHIVYEPDHHSDDSFRRAIAEGVQPHHWDFGPMPPVGGLDDDEVDAVIAYVRHRQETDGFLE